MDGSTTVLPRVYVLASDILMGDFCPNFYSATTSAVAHVKGTIYASYFHLPKVLMPAYDMLAAAIAMRSAVFGSNMPNRYVVQNALLIEQVMVPITHSALALHE
ncbi:hypothetical protein DYB37_000586 [Aphanomyces astaci]|uniref:Uncharacterized protein n=1 Tax=Aphanomyces astaci TaxID=112090 RepID=A0A3R6XX37_APHAT|nr:hypothetical protein DYB35_000957 [Aphanomyces astaci]RHZ09542.1 hypothetical protein DYB37_000586 [Aphanomyces astaci]